jgi:phage/plasmid-associated DNA primase
MDVEQNREWANIINEQLEHSDQSSIVLYFESLENKWKLDNDITNSFIKIASNFNITNLNNIDINFIETEKNKTIWEILGVQNKFKKFVKVTENDENNYSVRWEKLLEKIYYSERLLRTHYLLNQANKEHYSYELNEDTSALFKFIPIKYEKNTSFQNLLLFLLEELNECDYAKYGDTLTNCTLYKKIKTTVNGVVYDTYAWEPHMKVKQFIHDKCRKSFGKFDQWKNLTSGANNLKQAIEYLLECPDDELLKLTKDRHIFSFKNGVFLTKINKGTKEKPIWATEFVPYGTNSEHLSMKTVASKYFNHNFNDFPDIKEDSWLDIMDHCPNFKKILDYQEFTKEVQLWICIFMGKCAYDIGEMENWQILMYLLGAGNAGKSTILTKILQKWYEEDDVGIIPNNIEKQYGLKPHINKFLVLAPEMQGDCKLEQTDWQLMCEGGKNSFAQKYKDAESEYWKVPMAMAGNSLMKYKNMGGQVSRRTAVVNFSKKVIDTDQNLDKKLEKEIPMIMKMCITGYLWAVNRYGDKGIWKILPEYFHENKNEMDQTTNILEHFLKSDRIIIDKEKYIPEKIFKQAFNDHCRENNLGKEQWSFDFYSTTFSNNSIVVKKNSKKKYPPKIGEYITGTYFIGMDIRNEESDNNGNDDEDPE